jgi:hypothetical protein
VLSKYMALLSLSTSLPYSGPGGPCYLGPGGGLYSGSSVEKSKIWGRQESARERREEKSAFTDIATRLRSEHSIAWTLTCFFVGRLTALKKCTHPSRRLLQRYRPIAAGEPLHYGRQGSEMD